MHANEQHRNVRPPSCVGREAVSAASTPWRVRALQLDLARHMETVPYIKEYMRSAAESGYNMLVLYLEGRVKTKTFPFRSDSESYTPEQMGDIGACATRLGIELMPVVSTLGHCEQFLACEELSHLSETRHGRARFGEPLRPGSVVCPSLKETAEFFAGYLADLAGVFTGGHFHVGMDEAWDLAFCELCRSRWEREGLSDIFLGHLRTIHSIVGGLGKRLWMWDDMFELFSERLSDIPRDIVMCHWNYDEAIGPEGGQAHFVNRFRMDWLKEYERLGIDAVVCPWDRHPANIKAMTQYGRRHAVLGGLNTQWGISPRLFPPAQRTLTAFTGLLWSSPEYDPAAAWRQAVSRTLGGIPPRHAAAIAAMLEYPFCYPSPTLDGYRSGPLTRVEIERRTTLELALDVIGLVQAGEPSSAALRFVEWGARMELLHWELYSLVPAVVDPGRSPADTPFLSRRVEAARGALGSLKSQWAAFPEGLRLNETPKDAELPAHWLGCGAVVEDLRVRLSRAPSQEDWLLVLRLHLQDFYSAPYLKVQVVSADSQSIIFEGQHKHQGIVGSAMGGFYDLRVPFSCPATPEEVWLEGGGHGGQGVGFLELRNPSTVLKPGAMSCVSGPVERASALLRDDSTAALLGSADTLAQMHFPELARAHGVVKVRLAAS